MFNPVTNQPGIGKAHALTGASAFRLLCRYRFADVPFQVCQYFCVHAFEFSQIAVREQAIFFWGCRCDAHLCQQTIKESNSFLCLGVLDRSQSYSFLHADFDNAATAHLACDQQGHECPQFLLQRETLDE